MDNANFKLAAIQYNYYNWKDYIRKKARSNHLWLDSFHEGNMKNLEKIHKQIIRNLEIE